jgi:hypothetical protein
MTNERKVELEREIELDRWQRRAAHAEELIQRLFAEIAQLKAEIDCAKRRGGAGRDEATLGEVDKSNDGLPWLI